MAKLLWQMKLSCILANNNVGCPLLFYLLHALVFVAVNKNMFCLLLHPAVTWHKLLGALQKKKILGIFDQPIYMKKLLWSPKLIIRLRFL